jgi:hypothetical protein
MPACRCYECQSTQVDWSLYGLAAWPIGSVFMTADSAAPGASLGGTWIRLMPKLAGLDLWMRTA